MNTNKNPQFDLYMAEGTVDTGNHDGPIVEMKDRPRRPEAELSVIRKTLRTGQDVCEICGTVYLKSDGGCPSCDNGE